MGRRRLDRAAFAGIFTIGTRHPSYGSLDMMFQRESMPPPGERRPNGRRRALKGGIVVHSQGHFTSPCTIRNISAEGARITFKLGEVMPVDFILIDTWAGVGHRARIAWIGPCEAGVAFGVAFDMNALTDPGLGYLKRFWDQRGV